MKYLISFVILLLITLPGIWPAAEPAIPETVVAQSGPMASQACYAEVKWNQLGNVRRGPSEARYGIKRQLNGASDPVRVIGQDTDEEWVQVYLPEPVNTTGWLWKGVINLFGACSALPDTSTADNLEPDTPPAMPDEVPVPEKFLSGVELQENDQIFRVNDGIYYVRRTSEEPLFQAHILLADLEHPSLDVGVTVGAVPNVTATLVSDMVQEAEAFAAINGDFYGGNYLPQGLTVVNNEVIIAPKFRATFAITEDHEPVIGYFTREWTWQASAIAANGAFIPIQLVNLPCNNAWMCLYTDFMRNLPVRTGYDGLRVLLSPDYEVLEITEQYMEIPPGHFVLRAGKFTDAGRWIQENIAAGDTIELYLTTEPAWQDYEFAISGGPIIVVDGEFRQDCDPDVPEEERLCEEFTDTFREAHYFNNNNPRSGAGYNEENNILIMIMAEGYEVDHSDGITQRMMADLFIDFGADHAMEFDGGGSASMWLDQGFVNDFAARGERRVSNALMLFWND